MRYTPALKDGALRKMSVDACIEAAKALARDNPHWGDLESRAVQAALMEKMFTKIGRADLMNMLVCAVTRLASPAPSVP